MNKPKHIFNTNMLKRTFFGLLIIGTIVLIAGKPSNDNVTDERVEALLKQMTLAEKIGQMTQVTLEVISKGDSPFNMDKPWELDMEKIHEVIVNYHVGSILNTGGLVRTPEEWNKVITTIQDVATKDTRLNIPIIYGIDAIHGMYGAGATLYPHEVGLAATWNPTIAFDVAKLSAYETKAASIPWVFSPTLDLGIDPRWPRQYEGFGEDPYLSSVLGVASVKGFEGENIGDKNNVASCLKHFVGYGNPKSGKDRTPAWIPEPFLREYFLPPFQKAIEAGARSIMVNSGEINGMPVHASKMLLKEILRDELGFQGVVVTDWFDINNLVERHHVAANKKDAIKMAIDAGVDMSMVPYDIEFCKLLLELVKEGEITETRIDQSVRRILQLKLDLDLFENPTYDYKEYPEYGGFKHHQIARNAALESITLLKNKNDILPLKKDVKLLVTGPNANSNRTLNGGWSYTWQGEETDIHAKDHNTIYEALVSKSSSENITFVQGVEYPKEVADYKIDRIVDIDKAVAKAQNVDYILLCLGENTYTEKPGDLDELTLSKNQITLANRMIETGKPVILILNEGRPRIFNAIEQDIAAVVQTYLPGNEGGNALAEILYGDVNPSGKLPYTYPRYTNDLVPYYHKFSASTAHNDGNINNNHEINSQYEFGFGLSYTNFEYSEYQISKSTFTSDESIEVSIKVSNTGKRDGKEVVQLYTTDLVASLSPSVKRLRRFKKVELKAGETKTIQFSLPITELSFIGHNNQPLLEAGDFKIHCGGFTKDFVLSDSRKL
ncbi:glycoside hydrolase family 3 N-terminal domain-containing protein [Flammeovirga pectinis]|nr:glycoside hydrolase family 3 N-terminal domain-containing protein [Flammeovirga pectinis]